MFHVLRSAIYFSLFNSLNTKKFISEHGTRNKKHNYHITPFIDFSRKYVNTISIIFNISIISLLIISINAYYNIINKKQ